MRRPLAWEASLEWWETDDAKGRVITGGEPLLWRDAEGNGVEEVISLVRELGFFGTVICTNGTLPLESTADYLWVAMRGLRHIPGRRPTWASVTINNGTLTVCCCRAGIHDDGVCRKCGCTPAVETRVLQTLKPSALIENLRYL